MPASQSRRKSVNARGRVLVASTGNDSELRETIPITARSGANKAVVMSLGPGRRNIASLPDLAPGDRLEVTAEVEVTTDCARAGAGCVGNPYGFAPTVRARLLLARDRDVIEVAEGRALPLSDRRQERIGQREHHRVLVFTRAGIRIPDRGLPWGHRQSFVNLVLDAHHPAAGRRHVLLIGENEPGSADPFGGGRPGDVVRVVDGGELEVVRYPPRLKG